MADVEIEEFKDPMRCRDACYAPTVHIRISKANAHAMDDFFKNYEVDLDDDYHYQDTNEYEWYFATGLTNTGSSTYNITYTRCKGP